LYIAFAEVAPRDLDIAVIGQLTATDLPFSYQFEPGPVQMVGLETACRGRGLAEQRPERAAMHAYNALVLPDPDAECDTASVVVPARIRWKGEEQRDLLIMEGVRVMFSDQAAERNLRTQSAGLRFVVSPDSLD